MGTTCSACGNNPPESGKCHEYSEIHHQSKLSSKQSSKHLSPQVSGNSAAKPDISHVPECLPVPQTDTPLASQPSTQPQSAVTIESIDSPRNLQAPTTVPKNSRFSVMFDKDNQVKYFVLDEMVDMKDVKFETRQEEEEADTTSRDQAKLKASIAHRVKRESFVRMSVENISQKYKFSKKVGQGAYGSVFIAKSKKMDEQKAIKIIQKSKIKLNQQNLLSELMILRTLDHPNIVKLFEVYDNKSHYYVVTEVCRGGDLLQYARKRFNSQRYISRIMKQLLSAVNYLHKRSIVHRDLKSENILFEEKPELETEPVIKIIDFGTSCIFAHGTPLTEKVGSPYYVAPEVLRQRYNQKCDIWSCGVILYVMMCGAPPFQGNSRKEIFDNILNSKLAFKDEIWKKVSPQAKDLIRKMMERDVDKRLCADDCLKHPWMIPNETMKESVMKLDSDEILRNMQNFFFKDRFLAVVKTYVASLLTSQKDKRQLAEKFRQLDKDNSGMLETAQIFQAYRQLYGAITEDFIEDIMRRLDTNGSGQIDFTEFIVAADTHNRLVCRETLETAFSYFDKDGTGYIEIGELKQLLGNAEEAQIQAVMERLDLNHDNKISKEQFVKHVLEQQS